jgi:hypothetical protein
MPRIPALLALCVSLTLAAFAGEPADAAIQPVAIQPANTRVDVSPAAHGPNEFSFWTAGTLNAPHVIALSNDRRVTLAGFRYGRRIFNTRPLAFTYTVDAIPAVLVSQPRNFKGTNTGGREWIYGAGFSPIGFHFDVLPRHRLQPFVDASGGGVWFTRALPYSDSTKFNFMFEAGGGVRYFERNGHALTFGWKFHHISNAYRVDDNPGIDSNMIYTAFSFFK